MPFTVTRRDDLSLGDLCRLDREGASVTKTPHPGNIYLNNLAIAHLGLRLLFHDRTLGRKDRNFHPHKVIKGGMAEVIADPDVMLTHARVLNASLFMNGHFPVGERVAHCHLNALAEAVPGVRMRLYTDYLTEHEDTVREVLRLCSGIPLPYEYGWKRVVDEEGRLTTLPTPSWNRISKDGIYGLQGRVDGWVMPNIFNILVDGVIESRQFQTADIYHLSGPDMVNYLKLLEGLLHRLYDHLRQHMTDLPEELRFHVVPVASMRLVTTMDRSEVLDRIVALYLQIKDENSVVGATIRAADSKDEKHALVQQWGARRKTLRRELQEAVRACPEIFYNILHGTFVTQHDAIDRGGVYVHPWGIENSLSAVASAMQELYSLFEQ